MDWIEIIHLRAYSPRDCAAAIAAFHELTVPDRESGLKEVILLRNNFLDTDTGIFIRWRGEGPLNGKSRLGLQLSAAFSEYGHINHSVWKYETRLPIKQRTKPN
ncbi:MAG: hypothetical protein AB1427_12910 [Thermodesulfobacteriota bacterium]